MSSYWASLLSAYVTLGLIVAAFEAIECHHNGSGSRRWLLFSLRIPMIVAFWPKVAAGWITELRRGQ